MNAAVNSDPSEIPESVTAELEKLEQEGSAIVEVEGVSAILGDLGPDDDDELLGTGIKIHSRPRCVVAV